MKNRGMAWVGRITASTVSAAATAVACATPRGLVAGSIVTALKTCKIGFLYYRFGIMGESSFHARFGFGVDWRLYFKDRQVGNLKLSSSPVTPFVCGIFDL